MHGIVYDELHDEIVVTNPFAEAILFFRGGTNGEEAPIRIIQGPSTFLKSPDTLAVDPEHDEVFVLLRRQGAILVFQRDANGDAAPLRILRGPKTQITSPMRVAVDPQNDLLVVGNRTPGRLLVFNRTDEGDVEPKVVIQGPKTGIIYPQAVQVYPPRKEIIVAVTDTTPAHRERRAKPGFIGVWNYTDNGDVPPKAIIKGPDSMLIRPRGVALNAKDKEIYVVDRIGNSLFTFHFPQIF